jgi:prepilin-type N-terminal cleavage/methylation domain-containing protein
MRRQSGFSLVEMLVTLALFFVLSGGFYSVMFSGAEGSDTARTMVHISEGARLSLNRMIRDTREGDYLSDPSATSYHVQVDFDGDGSYENPNEIGDYEDLNFTYDIAAGAIKLNGEILVEGVRQIPAQDVFQYSSNFLGYDLNGDGVTTWQELDQAASEGVGNNNGLLDGGEVAYISSVSFALRFGQDEETTDFHGEAQLRNRR